MTNEELFEAGMIEELYSKNINLLHYICHKYEKQIEYGELLSLCNLAFMKAYRSYKLGQVLWNTYLTRCVLNEVNRNVYYINRHKEFVAVSLDQKIIIDNKGIDLKDIIPSSFNVEYRVDTNIEAEKVKKIISGMTEKYKEVLYLRIQGYKTQDISKLLGLSVTAVNSRYMRSKALISKRLSEQEA